MSEAARKYVLGRTFSDILCDHTKIKNIQPDVFRLPKHKGNAVVSCVRLRDKNKDDLIRIIKEENWILKCPQGLTNRPKCDKCAKGYTGDPPNCKKGTCTNLIYTTYMPYCNFILGIPIMIMKMPKSKQS